MCAARKHVAEIDIQASPERVFAALHTPSDIQVWWSANLAVVVPRLGGVWLAAWGANVDQPDYVSSGRIREFDPPKRLSLADAFYYARENEPSFDSSKLTTCFEVDALETGCRLRVEQAGFPLDPDADAFVAACEEGWANTLNAIKRYLER